MATNLTAVEDFRSEYPFVDFIKQGRPWFSGTANQFQDDRTLGLELTGNGPGAPNILVIALSATTPANPLRNLRVVPEGGICASDPLRRVAGSGACPRGDFQSFEDHSGTILFNPV